MDIKNWKIGVRLSLLAGILSVFLVAMGLYSLLELKEVNASLETVYLDRVLPLKQLKIVSDKYAVDIVDLTHKIRNGHHSWEDAVKILEEARHQIKENWTAYEATKIVGHELELVEQARPLLKEADEAIIDLEQIIDDRQHTALDIFVNNTLYQKIDPISEKLQELVEVQLDIAKEEYGRGEAGYHHIRVVTIAVLVIALLLAAGLSFLIIRGITGPVGRAVQMIEALAKGNLDLRLNLVQKDEIGRLAIAMDAFADNLRDEVLGAFDSLAAGDFTFQAEGLIREPLAKANAALCELVTQIQTAGEQIASGSAQIADAAQSLSQGATESAASMEQVSASMTEMGSQTRHTADNASQANQLAGQAKAAAETGNERMQDMVAAMFEINEAGQNISKIIKVIDEIAFQTNLLALNAAVEAARAGQHGKGFAVVAEEVRNLAGRSAQAARETAELIEGSVQKTQNGTQIAGETEAALKEIVTGVVKVTELVNEIAAAAGEQAEGIGQVNTGLGQIDQVTQANTANAEESAAAAEELSGQAEELRRMLSRFKVGGAQQARLTLVGNQQRSKSKRPGLPAPVNSSAPEEKPSEVIALNDAEFGKF